MRIDLFDTQLGIHKHNNKNLKSITGFISWHVDMRHRASHGIHSHWAGNVTISTLHWGHLRAFQSSPGRAGTSSWHAEFRHGASHGVRSHWAGNVTISTLHRGHLRAGSSPGRAGASSWHAEFRHGASHGIHSH